MQNNANITVLAIDNQISLQVVNQLEQHYEVVLWAGDMSDEDWVDEALLLGANTFISPDLDIPNLLERLAPDVRWIDVPQGLPTAKQYDYLMKAIKKG